METNRIDFTPTWSGKNTSSKTNASVAGGFAEMLFSAMGQKGSSATIGAAEVRPAETSTPKRRFDDHPLQLSDYRDQGESHLDRRVSNEQSRSPWRENSLDSNPGRGPEGRGGHVDASDRPQGSGAKPRHNCSTEDGTSPEIEVGDADGTNDEISAVDAEEIVDPDGEVVADDSGDNNGGGNADETSADAAVTLSPDGTLTIASVTEATESVGSVDGTTEEGEAVDESVAETLGTTASEGLSEALLDPTLAAPSSGLAGSVDTLTSNGAASAVNGGTTSINEKTGDQPAADDFTAALAQAEGTQEDGTGSESRAGAFSRNGERAAENGASLSRRQAPSNRHQPGPEMANSGTGQQAAQASAQTRSSGAGAASVSTSEGIGAVSFDASSGTLGGVPGWNLHLAQGNAVKRPELVANLRQHLQNLPVHEQVALSIQRSARDGTGSITLQLSPSELGRIHLKLDIDDENNVQASITVERPATLELLQRDSKALERALQDAGLKAGPGDLSFSLQGGDPEAFARDFGSGGGNGSGSGSGAGDGTEEEVAETVPSSVIATADGYVDVQI